MISDLTAPGGNCTVATAGITISSEREDKGIQVGAPSLWAHTNACCVLMPYQRLPRRRPGQLWPPPRAPAAVLAPHRFAAASCSHLPAAPLLPPPSCRPPPPSCPYPQFSYPTYRSSLAIMVYASPAGDDGWFFFRPFTWQVRAPTLLVLRTDWARLRGRWPRVEGVRREQGGAGGARRRRRAARDTLLHPPLPCRCGSQSC